MARHLRVKYTDYEPEAIYVTDDNALLFARDHLSRVFPGVPVFFSGVNDYGIRSSLDPALFTGVFERKEVAPNIEWLLRMDRMPTTSFLSAMAVIPTRRSRENCAVS